MSDQPPKEASPNAVPAQRAFIDSVPHNHALGMEVLTMEAGGALFRLPYREDLIGNPDTGVLHGGVITTLLDACSGAAVFAALPRLMPVATLDLRVDYLRPAEPGRAVLAHATCYKLTRNVAFTRAVAYHDDRDDPIASSVGTFMLSTRRGAPKPEADS
ncbi:MAG: PaaI family thioesterase [Kofleriaceae bacterium]